MIGRRMSRRFRVICVDAERALSLPSRVPRWDDGSLEPLTIVILTSPSPAPS